MSSSALPSPRSFGAFLALLILAPLGWLWTFPAASNEPPPDTPQAREEQWQQAQAYFAEKSFQKALELYEPLVEKLEGEQRGAALAHLAECYEKLRKHAELRALVEQPEPDFPWNARLLRVVGRHEATKTRAGWAKLATLDRALALFAAAGPTYQGEWLGAAFERIEGIRASNWKYDMDRQEWERLHWRENEDEIEVPLRDWLNQRGLEEDRKRRQAVLDQYAAILDSRPSADWASRALLERGMFRLASIGNPIEGRRWQLPKVDDLIARQAPGANDATLDRLTRWLAETKLAQEDWARLIQSYPNNGRADDAAFLTAHTSEHYLGDLVRALAQYRQVRDKYPESQWTTNCDQRIDQIPREQVAIPNQKPFVPGAAPVIQAKARNIKNLLCQLFPLPSLLDHVEPATYLDPEAFVLGDHRDHVSWNVATGCGDDHKLREVEIVIPRTEAGAYVLRVTGESSRAEVLINVTNLALALESGESESLAWVTDAQTGAPKANAEVLFRIDAHHKGDKRWKTHRLRTDARGIARWSYPAGFAPGEIAHSIKVTAAASHQGHSATLRRNYGNRDRQRTPRWTHYWECDRPAYRPDQLVQFKLSIRHWSGDQYESFEAPTTPFTVKIIDPRSQETYEVTKVPDATGSISGEFRLAPDATLGMYQLRVLHEDNTLGSGDERAFRVEEYRLPEFAVSVKTPDEPVLLGDPVKVEVQGQFLSGEALGGGKVRVVVTRKPYTFRFTPTRRHNWFYPARNEHNYWGEEEVFQAEAELDATGTWSFDLPTTVTEDGLDSTFTVNAWVTDSAQREESASQAIVVTKTEFFAHIEPRIELYSPGEHLDLAVRTLRANGSSRPVLGEMEIARRRDREEVKDDIPVVITEWEPILTVPFQTADAPQRFEEVIDESGEFRITFRAQDLRGQEVTAETRVWVLGADFTGRDYLHRGVQIVVAEPEHAVGDTARLAIVSQAPDAEVLVIRSAGKRILDVQTVRTQGHIAQLQIPLTIQDTPNFFVTALIVRNREFLRAQRQVIVPPTPVFLEATLAVSADEVLPGGEVDLQLQVKDADGNPVAGDFSLTVFDQAILSIQPEFARSPHQHFYPSRWNFGLREQLSLAHSRRVTLLWNDGQKPPRYRVHRLPNVMRQSWRYRLPFLSREFAGLGDATALPASGSRSAPTATAAFDREAKGELFESESARSLDMAKGMSPRRRGKVAEDALQFADDARGEEGEWDAEEEDGDSAAPARLRSNFSETAQWVTHFRTDAAGQATCRVTMPDSLTEWNGIARGVTVDGRTMEARVKLRTQKNIRARLAAPRFFRERDQVVLSAIVRNNFAESITARVRFHYPDTILESATPGASSGILEIPCSVPGQQETRLDFPFRVVGHGPAELKLEVLSERESDALVRTIPALRYGLERFIGGAGIAPDLDGASSSSWSFQIPEETTVDTRELVVDLTPSPAIALVESLPYLVRYPYGCVEQTLHRFVPAAVVAELLQSQGIELEEILPKRSTPIPAGFWGHLSERPLELFRPADLTRLIEEGATRLRLAQNSDGSWGWWAGAPGDPRITALVVDAYVTALDSDVELDVATVRKGAQWILNHLRSRDLVGEEQIYGRAQYEDFALLGRALFRAGGSGALGDDTRDVLEELAQQLYDRREQLGPQGQAMLALGIAALDITDDPRPSVLLRNLSDFEVRKPKWGTTHYGQAQGALRWYDTGVESTARVLEAFLEIAPDDERVPEMVRWLLENREGRHYDSTRSTAAVAFALTRYLRRSSELNPNLVGEVILNGESVGRFDIRREDLFTQRFQVRVAGAPLYAGEHQLEIRRSGQGPLYWNAAVSFYSRETNMPAAGNRIELERRYALIREVRAEREERYIENNREKTRMVPYLDRQFVPLEDGARLRSGDRVLVRVEVESANDFRYLIFEDRKPAGLEAVAVRSGYVGGTFGYREFRDDRVVHFSSLLREGKHVFEYELRAERPGEFRVLPVTGYAMYLPHVRANSSSSSVAVESD